MAGRAGCAQACALQELPFTACAKHPCHEFDFECQKLLVAGSAGTCVDDVACLALLCPPRLGPCCILFPAKGPAGEFHAARGYSDSWELSNPGGARRDQRHDVRGTCRKTLVRAQVTQPSCQLDGGVGSRTHCARLRALQPLRDSMQVPGMEKRGNPAWRA